MKLIPSDPDPAWNVLLTITRAGNIGIILAECALIFSRAPGHLASSEFKVLFLAIVVWNVTIIATGVGIEVVRLLRRKWRSSHDRG